MIERPARENSRIAVWALTSQGARLAADLAGKIDGVDLFLTDKIDVDGFFMDPGRVRRFQSLRKAVAERFSDYGSHVFVMAVGIVVRVIAEHVVHKTTDPAVVTVDDTGRFAISLLSGHIGGANGLAERVAEITGAVPVITTATDANRLPSADMMAVKNDLAIENPEAVKTVNMAFLEGQPVGLHDPYGFLENERMFCRDAAHDVNVRVDDRKGLERPGDLVLRPKILVAGIGCNRGTDKDEIRHLLMETLKLHNLSHLSLARLASVDVKQDEDGLLALADELNLSIRFYGRDELGTIEQIETPSETVEKHMGVKSVCEAAAILGAEMGKLIVPKRKSVNATVALARMNFTS
jgi:cobalt-precorrin 5A hydrolase